MTLYEKVVAMYQAIAYQSNDYVFRGSITEVYESTGLNSKFYSPVMNALRDTGAIEVEQRGNRIKETIIRLHGMPTVEQFDQAVESGLTSAYGNNRVGTVERRIRQLEGRLPDIDLQGYIVSLESRLQAVEDRLTTIEGVCNIGEATNTEAS